jgi:hypothetical protein
VGVLTKLPIGISYGAHLTFKDADAAAVAAEEEKEKEKDAQMLALIELD